MLSVFEGFTLKIDAQALAHICNLKILTKQENHKKWLNSSITASELLRRIEYFNQTGSLWNDGIP